MAEDNQDTTTQDAPERARYEVHVNNELAGHADYFDAGEQRIFHHTEVSDAYQGQGIAAQLVLDALTHTRAQGMRIVPVCAYVEKYVENHHEFDDALDPVTPDVLAALNSRPRH